jgi:methyl-accepting chemotaxis protein
MKFKLSIMLTAIMAILVTGIVVLLLQRFSGLSRGLNLDCLEYLADEQAAYWKGQEDSTMQVLRTLANIMGKYEDLPAQERNIYNTMLAATLEAEAGMTALYMVWKIDGMDNWYINRSRPRSSPAGTMVTGEYGLSLMRTNADIEDAIAYLNGPNAEKERVDNPVLREVDGRDTFTYTMMVPVINRRTNAVAGCVGCVLTIDPVQQRVESILRDYSAIAAMAIYDNTGFILASYVPERAGKMMEDTETIFGDYLQGAARAVREGQQFLCFAYSPVLMTNMEVKIVPFTIGNSDTTWSIMIALSENYMLLEVRVMTRFTIVLVITAMLVAAAIIFAVVHAVLPNEKAEK